MDRLSSEFHVVMNTFTPMPPPLRLEVGKVPTFAVDLSKMQVKAPEYWVKIGHLRELLGHEVKHASADGLPYTYRDALRHEALVMKNLGVPLETARNLLNVVYDAVVDLRVAAEGLDAKGMCDEWLELFPVKEEGTSYHLLQVLYKDFFRTSLPESEYERRLKAQADYRRLRELVKLMAQNKLATEGLDRAVLEAARLVAELSRVEPQPLPMDVGFDRGDPNVRADAAEVGLDLGLDSRQLAELMGVGEDELENALEEAAEDKVRAALWRRILSFRELFTTSSLYEVEEPVRKRWKPYSRRVDPSSVAKAPDDPRRWKEPALETVMAVEQEGETGGFSKLIMLIDCSGSTAAQYGGRTVLSYIKDAAYGLIAYAKQFNLPVAIIAFSDYAWVLSPESKDYVSHGKRVFRLVPLDSTNLLDAVKTALTLKPKRALIAALTDGLVAPTHLSELASQAGANRVVAAVVSNEEGLKTVKQVAGRICIYIVKPDEAGKTIVSELPTRMAEADAL